MRQALKKGSIIFVLVFLFFSIKGSGSPHSRIGIIGGEEDDSKNSYVGWVNADGVVEKVSDPSIASANVIDCVAMNALGIAIVGGLRKGDSPSPKEIPYAAFIFPDGKVDPLIFPPFQESASINTVAINRAGRALIGGLKEKEETVNLYYPYGAVVDPKGKVTPFSGCAYPTGRGKIASVAIDFFGNGIIGGFHEGQYMYAAKVGLNGETSELQSDFRMNETIGEINSVAMNERGQAVIGGLFQDLTNNIFYAAVVDFNGNAIQVPTSAFPSEKGQILAVAINSSGKAMIGGYSNFLVHDVLYAAFVNSDGTLKNVSPFLTQEGQILSVSVNRAGAGVIGGYLSGEDSTPYGALVSPNGALIPFKSFSPSQDGGVIDSVSIHDSGLSIIGGLKNHTEPYAALVAPDGTVIPFNQDDLPIKGGIWSVFTKPLESIFDQVIPKRFGLGSAPADSLFFLSTAILGGHLSGSPFSPGGTGMTCVADFSEEMRWPVLRENGSSLWVSPFGTYAHYKKNPDFPKMNHQSVGALVGFDVYRCDRGLIGTGLSYAFQNVGVYEDLEKAKGHQESITIYGTWKSPIVTLEGALWGGIYQMNNQRNVLETIFSKSRIQGTTFSPHLKVDRPFKIKKMVLKPFVQWDWANLWQRSIQEWGKSAMNLRIGSKYMSVLRSEFGLSLCKTIEIREGTWTFSKKVSYIHKTPFHAKKVKARYVGSDSTFELALFSNQIQNFGGIFFGGSFLPKRRAIPLIGLTYEGEFGSKGFAQTLGLEIEKFF